MAQLLDVEIRGLDALDKLESALFAATDVDEVADQAAAILLNRIRTRFLDEVAPDGTPWKPSKASLRRRRSGRGGGTLFDTGNLFHSIEAVHRGVGQKAVETRVPYADKHNSGDWPFMGFNEDDLRLMKALVIRRIEERANG